MGKNKKIEYSSSFTTNAVDLFVHTRWDIVAKYIYIKNLINYYENSVNIVDINTQIHRNNTSQIKWFTKLYSKHLKVLNGFYEEKTLLQETNKNSLSDFLQHFHQLYTNMLSNGYNEKYFIPVNKKGYVLNGAHRVAISELLDYKVPVRVVNNDIVTKLKINFSSFAFKDRSKHYMPRINEVSGHNIDNSIPEKYNQMLALEYCRLKLKNIRIITFFDEIGFKNQEKRIIDFIQSKFIIVYRHKIKLNNNGVFNLIHHSYWIDDTNVDVNSKTRCCFPIYKKNTHNIIVFMIEGQGTELDNISKSGAPYKQILRTILGGHHKLHSTDGMADTLIMSRLLYHQPSIDYINSVYPGKISTTITDKLFRNFLLILYNKQNSSKQVNNINKDIIRKILLNQKADFTQYFCLTSSYVMGIHGIRKPADLDFIMDKYNLEKLILLGLQNKSSKLLGLNQLEYLGHNKYANLYPSSLIDIIHNPNNYFYFRGIKCCNLDVVLQMKLKRNEKPKDTNDIALIRNFDKYHYLIDQVSIMTTTHVIPSAPSTRIIKMMIESLQKNLPGYRWIRHIIFLDSNSKNKNTKNYKQYLDNLISLKKEYPNIQIIDRPDSGLKQNYLCGIKYIHTPYIFFIEHDWIFTQKILFPEMIKVMNKYPKVNYIKFSFRQDCRRGGWDRILESENTIPELKLIKTDSWSNHPHLVRRKKWLSDWLQLVKPNKHVTGSHGLEEVLFIYYQADVKRRGFGWAHNKWGVYNYGTPDGKSIVEHIDGSEHY